MADKSTGSDTRSNPAERLEELPMPSAEITRQQAERVKGTAYKPTHALGNETSHDLGPDNIQK